MNDKDFLFWLQGVLEVKVKFNGSKDLEKILKDVKEHNEGGKLDVVLADVAKCQSCSKNNGTN